MELTERDYAEAFGVELPEEPAEGQEDASADGGTQAAAQEDAQDAAPDIGNDGGGEDGADGTPDDGQSAPAAQQSTEERRRQAHGRRQRELEAQRQQARDNAYAEMFRGQVNPYTGAPIRTEADFKAYQAAMRRQGKCLIRVTITGWGPIATGGFPPELA